MYRPNVDRIPESAVPGGVYLPGLGGVYLVRGCTWSGVYLPGGAPGLGGVYLPGPGGVYLPGPGGRGGLVYLPGPGGGCTWSGTPPHGQNDTRL